MGPDNIPSRILEEFVYELAEAVTSIFNTRHHTHSESKTNSG
jgi:hypothetical protein